MTQQPDLGNRPITILIQLARASFGYYRRYFDTIALVLLTRLLPFYLLIWFFPIANPLLEILFETVVLVPVIAAIVRHSWSAANGIEIERNEALLGGTMDEVLKLLATNVMILAIVVLLAGGGAFIYIAGAYLLSWVTLVVDQVVILEGRMLSSAIRRSLELVRTALPLSIALVIFVSLPEIAVLLMYEMIEAGTLRDLFPQVVRIVTLPFIVSMLTFAYINHFAHTEPDAQ